jgi:hypothetical protein
MTFEGDLVVVAAEQIMYALVKEISRDQTRKDEWWQVTMHLLTVPPQKVTWTLREPQFTGKEIFTMGGKPRFIKALDFSERKLPARKTPGPKGPGKAKKTGPSLRVVK